MTEIVVQVGYTKDGNHKVTQGKGETVLALVVNEGEENTAVQVIFAGNLSQNIMGALIDTSVEVLAQLAADTLLGRKVHVQ